MFLCMYVLHVWHEPLFCFFMQQGMCENNMAEVVGIWQGFIVNINLQLYNSQNSWNKGKVSVLRVKSLESTTVDVCLCIVWISLFLKGKSGIYADVICGSHDPHEHVTYWAFMLFAYFGSKCEYCGASYPNHCNTVHPLNCHVPITIMKICEFEVHKWKKSQWEVMEWRYH